MKAFVSYSQKNESLPELSGLLQDLDRLGIGVWVDKKLAGETIWWNEILDQIRACNVFVFVVTKESLQSAP